MTPAELAKSGTEHGQQRALFAWAMMAEKFGFEAAWDEAAYRDMNYTAATYANSRGCGTVFKDMVGTNPVPELKWFHAIPNGGKRDKQVAAMLKAEGVKKGIPDTFLPEPMWGTIASNPSMSCIIYAGLYIEMKRDKSEGRSKGRTSGEQDDIIGYLRHTGYAVSVCFTWDQAAKELQSYIEACRKGKSK